MSKLQGLLMNVIAKNMSTEGIGALQDVFDTLVSAVLFHTQINPQPLLLRHFLGCLDQVALQLDLVGALWA